MKRLKGVVVLGMSRSGTSAVTRGFAHAGYYVADKNEQGRPTAANAVGNYERLDIQAANCDMLRTLEGRWFDPPPKDAQRRHASELGHTAGELLDTVEQEAQGRPIAVKDPRIGVLLPIWLPVLLPRLHPVLVIRHPVEIARSLTRRDGIPVLAGLAMWELHMTGLLEELTGSCVSVIHYDAVTSDPRSLPLLVSSVQAVLDPAVSSIVRPPAAAAAVAPLRRERAEDNDALQALTGRQLALYRYLRDLPSSGHIIDFPAELRQASDAVELVRSHDLDADRFRSRLEAIESSTSWRLTRPVRRLGDLGRSVATRLRDRGLRRG